MLIKTPSTAKVGDNARTTRSSIIRLAGTKPASGRTAPARSEVEGQLEFIQFLLHDLQTPVAVLDATMQLLEVDLESADPEIVRTLRDARHAAQRIQKYVNHLVTSERFRRGPRRQRRRWTNLAEVLRELVRDYEWLGRESGVTLELDLAPQIDLTAKVDDVMLGRAFQNLLENAIHHAGAPGHVLVQARRTAGFEVRICNDGPAIPHADRGRLFDKFMSSDRGANGGGTGLGLYFCRLVVESHGGSVRVEDDHHWPACFVIELPAPSTKAPIGASD